MSEELTGLYPPNPSNVPASVMDPSPGFRKEVKKVMGSVFLFFVVYLVLVLLSVALAFLCIYLGIRVIIGLASIIGVLAGLGIISIGILVFIFLVKFIFSVKKFDESGSVQVTEKEEPRLFGFIRHLTRDTQTQFPKKIILSPDVNACVFYNDSFWSMLFPVRKNLQIGLGLVNTLTISEFKAVMAHEFGHFSQRSMKLGSFVYNVNKVIYNMLFENRGYSNFLQGWGQVHWTISIFMSVTVEIVKVIQRVLQGMYQLINKSYMALSREMEFHADAVAAGVSGSGQLITALRKVEISDLCYNTVIEKANEWLKEKQVFENIYTKHQVVMKQYGSDFQLPLVNNVPVADNDFYRRFRLSKVNISNQWASHPEREDRESHLEQLAIASETDLRSAWVLFSDPEDLQRKLTETLYRTVPADMRENMVDETVFNQRFAEEVNALSLPEAYHGFYDNRQPAVIDVETFFSDEVVRRPNLPGLDELFGPDRVGIPQLIHAFDTDIRLLEAIVNKQVQVKTFDYGGEKYNRDAAPGILERLKQEQSGQKQKLENADKDVVAFFARAARQKGEEAFEGLRSRYLSYFGFRKEVEEFIAIAQRIVRHLSPLAGGEQVTLQQAEDLASGLRKEGNALRPLLDNWKAIGVFAGDVSLAAQVDQFLQANYHYFSGDSFFDQELNQIHQLVNEVTAVVMKRQFGKFKEILCFQLEQLPNP